MRGTILLIIAGIIVIILVSNILVGADSNKKNYYERIGRNLAQMILQFLTSVDDTLWKTPKEKLEVWYFLICEINKMVINKFHDANIQEEIEIGLLLAIVDNIDEDWKDRKSIYSQCTLKIDNLVPTPGSSLFALSHFIKIARKDVAKKDVADVLIKKRELKPDDLDQFLDIPEGMVLNQVMPMMLISIKKFFDQLCNELI